MSVYMIIRAKLHQRFLIWIESADNKAHYAYLYTLTAFMCSVRGCYRTNVQTSPTATFSFLSRNIGVISVGVSKRVTNNVVE